jgi:hypothetical protein
MLPEYIKALAVLETKLDHLIRSVDHREGLITQLEKRIDEIEGYRKYMLGVIATLFTLSGVATYAVQQVAHQNSNRLSNIEVTQEALCFEARRRYSTLCYQGDYQPDEK